MMPERRQEPEYEGELTDDPREDLESLNPELLDEKDKDKKVSSLKSQLKAELQPLFELDESTDMRQRAEELLEIGVILNALEGPSKRLEVKRLLIGLVAAELAVLDVVIFTNLFSFNAETSKVLWAVAGIVSLIVAVMLFYSRMKSAYKEFRKNQKEDIGIFCEALGITVEEDEYLILCTVLNDENRRRATLKMTPRYRYSLKKNPTQILKILDKEGKNSEWINHTRD